MKHVSLSVLLYSDPASVKLRLCAEKLIAEEIVNNLKKRKAAIVLRNIFFTKIIFFLCNWTCLCEHSHHLVVWYG